MRWVRALVVLAGLVVWLQPTGVWHVLADAIVTVSGSSVHQGRLPCSHEQDGEDCPPTCADCHHFVSAPALPGSLPAVVVHRPVHTPTAPCIEATRAPPAAPSGGLDRPPRA